MIKKTKINLEKLIKMKTNLEKLIKMKKIHIFFFECKKFYFIKKENFRKLTIIFIQKI